MSPPRLLALDFDGVVSDSAPESFVVALRTCAALRDAPLPSAARALADQRGPTLAEVRACSSYAPFLDAMPLGNRAEDFGVVLRALAEEAPLESQSDYNAQLERHSQPWRDAFHSRFYQERQRLRGEDLDAWLALMAPYSEFLALLRRRSGDIQLAIATAKDGESVRALLAAYGAVDLFPDELVVDKEAGRSKVAHLTRLSERTGIALSEILFFDDKVNHLDEVAKLGVRCGLAAWGYNGPREEALAREKGHLLCNLSDVEAQIFL
jgi:phosphoglycolate phosphatase-like HAD superfamily hydrolase